MELNVIGFDADDTLWVNEVYYRNTEKEFYKLIEPYSNHQNPENKLYQTEVGNLPLYGYGAKGFLLSMIEAGLEFTENRLPGRVISRILEMGKELLNKPVVLLDDVKKVLDALYGKYRLIVVTKGDLLDQERKLKKSGLESYFHHIEIMSDKQPENYRKLLNHLNIKPENFLMIGNSLKSDILPVLELGAYAVHVPCSTTWQHETAENTQADNPKFLGTMKLREILEIDGI